MTVKWESVILMLTLSPVTNLSKLWQIWERNWMYWLCVFITRCAHDTCYRLIQAWCINCPITLFRQKHDTYTVLFVLKLGWWWPITLEYFVIVSIEMLYHLSRTSDKLFRECYEKALFSTYKLIKNFCNYLSYTCLRLQTKRLCFLRISHRPFYLSKSFPLFSLNTGD